MLRFRVALVGGCCCVVLGFAGCLLGCLLWVQWFCFAACCFIVLSSSMFVADLLVCLLV